jgi:hypothetical protein
MEGAGATIGSFGTFELLGAGRGAGVDELLAWADPAHAAQPATAKAHAIATA